VTNAAVHYYAYKRHDRNGRPLWEIRNAWRFLFDVAFVDTDQLLTTVNAHIEQETCLRGRILYKQASSLDWFDDERTGTIHA